MEIKLELKSGEVICDKCNGHGVMSNTVQRGKHFFIEKSHCDKCHGEGKLDWIENITGKEEGDILKMVEPMKYMRWTWSSEIPELEPKWKKSSNEIIESIDPKARKRLERKIAYNLSR